MEIKDIQTALRVYNKIEDERDKIRGEYESKDGKLKAALATVEQYMLQEMKALELQAFEMPGEGVATIKVKRRFGAADWSLVWDWVVREKCPHMLQKRLLDTEIAKYLENTGQLPPGVNTEAKLVIAVSKRG